MYKNKKLIYVIVSLILSISLVAGCSKAPSERERISYESSIESDSSQLSSDIVSSIDESISESESGTDSEDLSQSKSEISSTESSSAGSEVTPTKGVTPLVTPTQGTQIKQEFRDYFSNISFANPVPVLKNKTPLASPIEIKVPTSMPRWQRYMLSAFQGLANRKQSRIFLNWEASDSEWMRRWSDKDLYNFKFQTKQFNDVYEMIVSDVDYYNVKGLLIYDESIINQEIWSMLINVYTGICAAENLIPVPKSRRNDFKDLPVIFDASSGGKALGRWATEAEAYIWVIDNYPVLSRKGAPVAIQHPSCLREMDYYVMNKMIPLFFWNGMPLAVRNKFRDVLTSTGPNALGVGCWDIPTWSQEHSAQRDKPSMGNSLSFVQTDGDYSHHEHILIHLMSGYGKAMLTTAEKGVQNLSFQQGLPVVVKKPVESPIMPAYNSSKNYMTLHVSDGDNICYLNESIDGTFGLTTSRWWHEASRGTVNIAWSIAPGAYDLLPGLVSYLNFTASDMDSFVGATSGWGYMLVSAYGKFLPSGTDRNAELEKFYKSTGLYHKALGINSQHVLWSYYKNYTQNRSLQLADFAIMARAIKSTNPSFNAFIGEYGRNSRRNIPWSNTVEVIEGVPLFNAVNDVSGHLLHESTQDFHLNNLVNDINAIPAANKKFMHVFCTNWFVRPNSLEELVNRLGSDYVAVSSNHLGLLYR